MKRVWLWLAVALFSSCATHVDVNSDEQAGVVAKEPSESEQILITAIPQDEGEFIATFIVSLEHSDLEVPRDAQLSVRPYLDGEEMTGSSIGFEGFDSRYEIVFRPAFGGEAIPRDEFHEETPFDLVIHIDFNHSSHPEGNEPRVLLQQLRLSELYGSDVRVSWNLGDSEIAEIDSNDPEAEDREGPMSSHDPEPTIAAGPPDAWWPDDLPLIAPRDPNQLEYAPRMRLVPGGRDVFIGWNEFEESAPEHVVPFIDPFYMAATEVTTGLWQEVLFWAKENGYQFREDRWWNEPVSDAEKALPIHGVSWREAVVWCNALSEMSGLPPAYYSSAHQFTSDTVVRDATDESSNRTEADPDETEVAWRDGGYRLPTEAEWEYAARYSEDGQLPGNLHAGANLEPDIDAAAWTNRNAVGEEPQPVGLLSHNDLGIYDLTGNVAEYVFDLWNDYGSSPDYTEPNTRGPDESKYTKVIFRGGSVGHDETVNNGSHRMPWDFRFSSRASSTGFRVVRGVSP